MHRRNSSGVLRETILLGFVVFRLFQTSAVLADPPPAPTLEASRADIMGLRLGTSPAEIKPIMEAAIQVKLDESSWPDGTRYVSRIAGTWNIPSKNNPAFISRGEIINLTSPRRHPETNRSGSPARHLSLTASKYPRKRPFKRCLENTASRPTSDALASITNGPTESSAPMQTPSNTGNRGASAPTTNSAATARTLISPSMPQWR